MSGKVNLPSDKHSFGLTTEFGFERGSAGGIDPYQGPFCLALLPSGKQKYCTVCRTAASEKLRRSAWTSGQRQVWAVRVPLGLCPFVVGHIARTPLPQGAGRGRCRINVCLILNISAVTLLIGLILNAAVGAPGRCVSAWYIGNILSGWSVSASA